jgi:DNA-binding CsgD family transcriptional regulator
MRWLGRFRRKIHQPPGEPGPAVELPNEAAPGPRPAFRFPLELVQSVTQLARSLRVDPEALAGDLLQEAVDHRRLVASVKDLWKTLSPREREVAWLSAGGLSNYQIATRLSISPETVKYHLYNGLHKLGLKRKGQLRSALEEIEWQE